MIDHYYKTWTDSMGDIDDSKPKAGWISIKIIEEYN